LDFRSSPVNFNGVSLDLKQPTAKEDLSQHEIPNHVPSHLVKFLYPLPLPLTFGA